MTRLIFTDGEVFETEGLPRIEQRLDGLYIIGRGYLIPVKEVELIESVNNVN